MDMVKTTASNFKAKMGKFMRVVRAGKEVLITDRSEPVAKLVPLRAAKEEVASLSVSQPRDPNAPPLGQIEVRGLAYRGTDTTQLLREDREHR